MAISNKNRILLESTITGTGTYTVSPVSGPWQASLTAAVADGNTFTYDAYEVDGNGNPTGTAWETGLGTVGGTGTTLARTTIYESSTGSAISWGTNTHVYIACSPLTEGTSVVRQPGGTPGIDELQTSYASTKVTFKNAVTGRPTNSFEFTNGDQSLFSIDPYGSVTAVNNVAAAGGSVRFDLGGGVSLDKIVDSTTKMIGGNSITWYRNTPGEAALESAFTRSDATLTSTNISLTVGAGLSYRIIGYLIVSNSVAGEGAKFDFDGGTATATTFDVAFNAVGGTVVPGTIAATALATDLNYTSVTGTTRIFVQGYLEVNAGGTFILRASEDTTATGTMTLGAGSWLALCNTVDK